MFNGTGANVVSLRALLRPWQGVICAETAHLNVDECGAPEALGGVKLLTVPTPDGKLTPELMERRIVRVGDEHVVQAGAVSITQSTELGTLYSRDGGRGDRRVRARARACSCTSTARGWPTPPRRSDCALREACAGADIVSFGGTKVGLLAAEAVVVLQPRARAVAAVPAQAVDAARLQDALRLRPARGAADRRAVAARRRPRQRDGRAGWPTGVREHVEITQAVQANSVFAILPPGVAERLQEDFRFYVWDEHTGEVRWMCAWDTREEDVDAFAAAVADAAVADAASRPACRAFAARPASPTPMHC